MKFNGERYVPSIEGSIALQHYHRYAFVTDCVNLQNLDVVDVACGEGYGSFFLSKYSKTITGIDISEEAITCARNTYVASNLRFVKGDVTLIPLPDHSADIVVSFETIEHHDKHHEMMSEIIRVLKPEGLLFISSPDKGFYEKYYPGQHNPHHVKELYKNEFHALLESYFIFNKHFMQNNIYGSCITSELHYKTDVSIPLHHNKNTGESIPLESRFNISVASNVAIHIRPPMSVFSYGSERDILTELQRAQNELSGIYTSFSWKVLSIVKYPIRIIRKKFKIC